MQTETSVDDQISLMDVCDFLADGWKVILSIALIGTGIGVVTSLGLPDQFEAKGVIQAGNVVSMNSMNSMNSIDAEPATVLIEKMRSPTYYDSKTLAVCVNEGGAGNSEAFAKAVGANIAKNSNFVSVSYRAESRDKAMRCLELLLVLVVERQKPLMEASSFFVRSSLDSAKKKADELRKSFKQMEIDRDSHLDFKSAEYPVTILIANMFQSKIQDELSDTEKEISKMEAMLKPPHTQEAKFLTPIFASEQRVSPHRSQIVMISAMASLFFGVLMVILRLAFASVKKRREEQFKSASITP